jgi:hypothetical protein
MYVLCYDVNCEFVIEPKLVNIQTIKLLNCCLSFYSPDSVASVKPSRLLPTVEPKTFPNSVPEEILSKVRLEESDAFYMLELSTSRELSSSLLDKNAAILICLIDVDGDSLLQRVPAIFGDQLANGSKALQSVPFQSGSVDIITFKGPKLQTVKEIWIGLESGIVST